MPEYANMKRLDTYHQRLYEWCQPRMKTPQGYEFLNSLFAYNPDARLSAHDALKHRWFQEEPRPTRKYVEPSGFDSLKSHECFVL